MCDCMGNNYCANYGVDLCTQASVEYKGNLCVYPSLPLCFSHTGAHKPLLSTRKLMCIPLSSTVFLSLSLSSNSHKVC